MTLDRAIRYALELAAMFHQEADEIRWEDHKRYEDCRFGAVVLEEFARSLAEMDQTIKMPSRMVH